MLEQFLIKHHVFGYPPTSASASTGTTTTTITTTTASSTGTNTGPSSATATTPSSVGTTHRRTDSFADAFPHFESRVLAASNVGSGFGSVLSRTRGHGKLTFFSSSGQLETEFLITESMDMGRPDLSLLSERRLRMANSSPDVKALFNAPAYIYNLEALEAASSVGSGDDLGYAESYEGGGGYAGSSGEGTGKTGGVGDSDLDYWTPTSLVPIVRSFSLSSRNLIKYSNIVIHRSDTDSSSPRRAQTWVRLVARSKDQRTASNSDAE